MHRRTTGFIFTELIVSITVLGILMVCLGLALHSFRQFNHYQWMRQRCMAAAQAQLDYLSATGQPLPDETAQGLWPRITTEVQTEAGQGQWLGLQRVEIKAHARSFRRRVCVTLSRYMEDRS